MKVLLIAHGSSVLGHLQFTRKLAESVSPGGKVVVVDGGFSYLRAGETKLYEFAPGDSYVGAGAGAFDASKAQEGLDALNPRDFDIIVALVDKDGFEKGQTLSYPKEVFFVPTTIDDDITFVSTYGLGFDTAVTETANTIVDILWAKSRVRRENLLVLPIRVMGGSASSKHAQAVVEQVCRQGQQKGLFTAFCVTQAQDLTSVKATVQSNIIRLINSDSSSLVKVVGVILPDAVCDMLEKHATGTGENILKAELESFASELSITLHDAERVRTSILAANLGLRDMEMIDNAVKALSNLRILNNQAYFSEEQGAFLFL